MTRFQSLKETCEAALRKELSTNSTLQLDEDQIDRLTSVMASAAENHHYEAEAKSAQAKTEPKGA